MNRGKKEMDDISSLKEPNDIVFDLQGMHGLIFSSTCPGQEDEEHDE
jgi:hypothetical protein